mgnify:CR=1 FL=1
MELKKLFLLPFLAGLLASCGYKAASTRLQPPDPALSKAEQQQARTDERRRVEAGLAIPAGARPQRVDDLTVQLDTREDDPFALPPAGTVGAAIPFPGPFPGDSPPATAKDR